MIGNRVNEPVIGNCQLKTLDCRSVTADICALDAIYENGKIEGFNPAAAITPEDDCYGNEKEIHVILDNLNTHKPKNDRWLKSHPNVHFHFAPTHTSWLNQIECWFSILSRQALQGASFVDVKQLREAIDDFTSAYNTQAAPFEWRQGEIKQQPMRDNIAYFCR